MTYIARLVVLALTLAAAAGCVGPEPGQRPNSHMGAQAELNITPIDQVWTDDPRLAVHVRYALHRWRAATGREWEFRPGPRTVSFGVIDPAYIGYNDGTYITVKPEWSESPRLVDIVLHEVGHYYSGGHVTDKDHAMSPGIGHWLCLTEQDLLLACASGTCLHMTPECDVSIHKVR